MRDFVAIPERARLQERPRDDDKQKRGIERRIESASIRDHNRGENCRGIPSEIPRRDEDEFREVIEQPFQCGSKESSTYKASS
jgi:hypothetical protein